MTSISHLSSALSGRYEIEREIGEGGMATVYLARDVRHDRRVALKLLRPELAAAIGATRFLQEIRTTANLQHPHILPLHDSGEVDGTVFYVMPYVEGESLRSRLASEKQLPLDDAVRIATEVASALDYAHRQGVIHRDIKPENILLQDNTAVVADFGIAIATMFVGGDRLTRTGVSLGTPAYMSPEQAMGEPDLTPRSDIYALGCVVYEMIAGEPPFTGPTAQAIIARVITDTPRPLHQLRHTVPLQLEAAVATSLEKVAADRWPTASAFAAALHGTPPGPSQVRGSAGNAQASATWAEWRTVATRTNVALVIAALVIGGLAERTMSRAKGGAGPEPRHWTITLPDSVPLVAARDHFGIAQRSLAISADGRQLVYVSPTSGSTQLALARLDVGTVVTLHGTDGGRLPSFSPDGRFIAFVVGDSEIRKMSLDDGATTHLATTTNPWSLTWLSDGQVYFADAGCPGAVPSAGGPTRQVGGTPCVGQWLGASIEPVASRTDWLALDGPTGLHLISTSSGEVRKLTSPHDLRDADAIPGAAARFLASGYVVLVRDSTLFAAPFDLQSLHLLSDPKAVLTGVRHESVSGHAHMDLALDGTFVWASGGDESLARFVWVGRNGAVQDTAFIPAMSLVSYALSPDGRRVAIDQATPTGSHQLLIADLERHSLDRVAYSLELEPTNWIRGGRALAVRVHRANGTVRGGLVTPGAAVPVDTVAWGFINESANGAYRCRDNGGAGANTMMMDSASAGIVVWKTAGPPDSLRVAERMGGWCRFSPDSRFVSWVNPEGLFVAATDPRLARSRVRVAPPGADEPRWSPDGKRLLYRQAMRWYEVQAPGAELKPAGAPRLLFQGNYLQAWASWELGPDERFLLLQGVAPIRLAHLNVITNFPRFLSERLGAQ